MSIIGITLKKVRRAKQITQIELSLKTGLSQSHISNIEKGVEPELATLFKICEALGVNPLVFAFKAFNEIDLKQDISIDKYDEAVSLVKDKLK